MFVNPNSHDAVRFPLNKIGESAGVHQCGGSEREWLTDVCDGLSYFLIRNVLNEARKESRDNCLREKGMQVGIEKMTKSLLKEECEKRSLPVMGNVPELKARLLAFVDTKTQSGEVVLPKVVEGKFDWFVCETGGLHWEMSLTRVVIDVLWPLCTKLSQRRKGTLLRDSWHGREVERITTVLMMK